jgi:hypothetical protein
MHERAHFDDVDCPAGPGLHPPPFKRPDKQIERECELMKKQVPCMETAIRDLKLKNKGGCNDKCIKMGGGKLQVIKDTIRTLCR